MDEVIKIGDCCGVDFISFVVFEGGGYDEELI